MVMNSGEMPNICRTIFLYFVKDTRCGGA